LPTGGTPGGARCDTSGGAGAQPTSPNGQDLLAELEETRACVDEINSECAIEAERLSQLVVGISNALDLDMVPIQDIPQLPMSAREVLTTAGLILEHLREVQASSTSPWD
jgi:hypothetical protein